MTERRAEPGVDVEARAARAMDAICFADPVSGRILDVNARWCHLFGFERAEARTLTLDQICAEPEVLEGAIRNGATGNLLEALRGSWQRRDGEVFTAHFSLASLERPPDAGAGASPATVVCIALRDPRAPSQVHAALGRSVERATRQQAALIALSEQPDDGDFEQRLRQVLRVDGYTLDVERVSYWSLHDEGQTLRCELLFRKTENSYHSGALLAGSDHPRYLEALRAGQVIVADDARQASETADFADSGYLDEWGIGAMLDVPVYVHGRLVGVVCHEHVGQQRAWSLDEELFAMGIGQQCALAIEGHHRHVAEEALRHSEARLRAIVEASPVPMLVTSREDGFCLFANAAASAALGVPPEQMPKRKAGDFYADPSERPVVMAELERRGHVHDREMMLRRHDDQTAFWASVSIRPVVLADEAALVVGFADVTERKRMEDTLRHMALHDPLTGLPNRSLFYDLLRREMAHARRTAGYSFALLFVDVDNFKTVNDTFGHEAGDTLLVSIGSRLRSSIRPHDAVARIGGDEFTVLLSDVESRAEALTITERIATLVRMPHRLGPVDATPSVSIGVVLHGETYDDPDVLLGDADTAMYRAKDLGRSRYEVFARSGEGER